MASLPQNSPGKGITIAVNSQNAVAAPGGRVEITIKGKSAGAVGLNGRAYLLIDCSGSMAAGGKFEQARRGALDFAHGAKAKGYAIGIITFADEALHLCDPQEDVAVISEHLNSMQLGSSTDMAAALKIALEKFSGKTGNRAVVVVTDGQPNAGGEDPIRAALNAARELKEADVDIITIGTDDADTEFLKQIATRSDLSVKVARAALGESISSATAFLPEGPRRG